MLTSENIYLRTLEPEDADIIWRWENDTSLWRVSHTKVPFSKKMILDYVTTAHDINVHRQIRFIICDNETKESIGTVDLFDYDAFHRRAGIGILIADPKKRQKGIAQEALKVVIDYAFETLCLKNIYCNILEDNEASHQLFKKAGFSCIGTKKDWIRSHQGWQNELLYQIIKEEI